MELKKLGITVGCEHCEFAASRGAGEFDVTVPVTGTGLGIAGVARLHCEVSSERHSVELVQWGGADTKNDEFSAKARRCLTAALALVAERRICGNRHICPAEVVGIVEQTEKQAVRD